MKRELARREEEWREALEKEKRGASEKGNETWKRDKTGETLAQEDTVTKWL